jgi:Domain of unknown function (DUF4345)
MIGGYVASAILAAAGVAGIVAPQRVGRALETDLAPARARAEFRIAYACFAAIGIEAVITGSAAVFLAVGTLWLGAAFIRVVALVVDRPHADGTYWLFLALELALGCAAILLNR